MAKYNSCTSLTLNSIDATCGESRASIKRVLVCPKEGVKIYRQSERVIQIFPIEYAHKTLPYPQDYRTDPFVEYRFRRNTGSYTSTYTGDNTTGSQVVTTEVSLQFSKAENQKRLEFQKLTGRPCVMIIEDNYGQYILLGYDAPIVLTNTVMQSGTAKSDLSGFTLTFTEESNVFPPFIQEDFDISALLISRTSTTIYSIGSGFTEKYFESTPLSTITATDNFGPTVLSYLTSPYPYFGTGTFFQSQINTTQDIAKYSINYVQYSEYIQINGNNSFSIQAKGDEEAPKAIVSLSYTLKNEEFENTPLYATVTYRLTGDGSSTPPYKPTLTLESITIV